MNITLLAYKRMLLLDTDRVGIKCFMKYYYTVWVDLIVKARSRPQNRGDWQIMTMIFMTVPMAINFLFLVTIIEQYVFGYKFYYFEFPLVSRKVGEPISFAVRFLGPPLLLNYLLIFWRRRYEKLIPRYKYYDGKLAASFIITALFIPLAILLIGVFYFDI